ncbi:MAG: redoxin domain-containing protein [Bacteroidales bacterium]|nr:redoxin domain-containing protein [Bacteroidales bacterium]
MKKFLLLASAALMMVACAPQNGLSVKGQLTSDNPDELNGPVYLHCRGGQSDTTEMVNGEFLFEVELAEPTDFYLMVGAERLPLFLEHAKYTITGNVGDLRNAKIEGGDTQRLLNRMKEISEEIKSAYNLDSLAKAFNSTQDQEERDRIYAVFQKVKDDVEARKQELIEQNKATHFAFQEFSSSYIYMEFEEAKARFQYYAEHPKFKNLSKIEKIKEQLDLLENVQVGKQAPDFTMNDPQGNPITLSDIYKNNKVTMIDFWAGWCGPCRQFNPTLVNIYKEFHARGFEILGVSLDSDHAKWTDAIKTDNLTWPQVSELKQWNTSVAKTYAVRYIPQNLFVDENGVIIARVLSEEEIVNFLNEKLQ